MLEEYTGAFARYLRTGTVGPLSDFCARDADLSRLRVYRNGFLKACVEALRANYPSVERLVGGERFPALARPYVEAHPPYAGSLVEYGEGFPRHVRDTCDTHGLDYLASFAALDRAWTEVHFSEDDHDAATPPDGAVREAGALSKSGRRIEPSAPEPDNPDATGAASGLSDDAEAIMNLRGRLSPWVRLVSLDRRVLHVWNRLRQEDELVERTEIRRMPQHVLIWRRGADMLHRDLTLPEHAFIAGVAAGRPCGEAAGAALEIDATFDLAATFASLLHHHMLSFEH